MKTLAVMTSGGDAPGMNSCLRAVVRTALHSNLRVFGIRHAYKGLVEGRFMKLNAREVGGIIQRGGTFLQSGRFPDFVDTRHQKQAIHQLKNALVDGKAARVDGLVVIGGEGSMNGALALHRLGFPVIGIPASIDNDIYGTQMAIGVDTALNTIMEAIDKLRDTASSHQRVFIIETMGHTCGYLALVAGIIGGAEKISIPDCEASPQQVMDAVREAYARKKTHAIIVVAEGLSLSTRKLLEKLEAMNKKAKTDFEFRVTTLGHIQRGGRPTASDRLLATRFGVAAVNRLMAGESGIMVASQNQEIVTIPLEDVCAKKQSLDMEYYNMAQMLSK